MRKARKPIINNLNFKKQMETKPSKTDQIFLLVKDEENKVHIAVGNKVVSAKTFDTYNQAEQYIGTKPYELIFNTCFCITQNLLNDEKETNSIQQKIEPVK